jgi:hypothetical protein
MNKENENMTNDIAAWPFKSLIEEVFLKHFQKNGEASIPHLVNGIVSKMAFLSAYKRLTPIENMPVNEKKEMKKYVIAMFPEKSPEEKIEACKIIYTIGTLL